MARNRESSMNGSDDYYCGYCGRENAFHGSLKLKLGRNSNSVDVNYVFEFE